MKNAISQNGEGNKAEIKNNSNRKIVVKSLNISKNI